MCTLLLMTVHYGTWVPCDHPHCHLSSNSHSYFISSCKMQIEEADNNVSVMTGPTAINFNQYILVLFLHLKRYIVSYIKSGAYIFKLYSEIGWWDSRNCCGCCIVPTRYSKNKITKPRWIHPIWRFSWRLFRAGTNRIGISSNW